MFENQNSNINSNGESSTFKSVGAFVWDLVKILLIALVIIVPFRMFVAEPFVVSGSSMLPNFYNHDYLIIDRFSYLSGNPVRGEVIVLKYPKDPSQYFIKRVVGLPGETVEIRQGSVFITNSEHSEGFKLPESYLPSQAETFGKNEKVRLGSREYFVLGDNRTASSDSRVWGILPQDDIVGRVWVRVFPFSEFGTIKTPTYN
ncbi:MAG: signal peptidase I [Patescibacteria group bacterium]|nr:signal peptidase I [Patescibacteria group bacterium]